MNNKSTIHGATKVAFDFAYEKIQLEWTTNQMVRALIDMGVFAGTALRQIYKAFKKLEEEGKI